MDEEREEIKLYMFSDEAFLATETVEKLEDEKTAAVGALVVFKGAEKNVRRSIILLF